MLRNKANFAVFILTHGRPDNVITFQTLKKSGYTGKTYFIVDNEDPTVDKYRANFGSENVIMFDKKAAAETFDTGDSWDDRRAIVYARNASFDIAKELGLDYFLQLDDDYPDFLYRFVQDKVIHSTQIRSFDSIVLAMLTLLEETNAATVAMSQGGDHMGGAGGPIRKGLLRKAMNSFFLRTDRRVEFIGKINDDVNSYIVNGSRGDLYFTTTGLQLNQVATQSSSGGMTEMYKDSGTYVKSFYTVMMSPSCVTIRTMGRTDRRLHHSIRWDNAVPKIINQKYKKAGQK
jgi:hypothetical protein